MDYKVIGNCFIVASGEAAPSAEEEREILTVFKKIDLDRMRMLVFTRGGAPSAMLRKQMHEVLQGRSLTTAIVTDVYFIRGIMIMMSWFNKRIRVFPTTSLEEPFRYLELSPEQHEMFRRETVKLPAEVAVRSARRRY